MAEQVEHRNELAYDVGNAIGWMMGSVVICFARPMAWAMFHDWSHLRQDFGKARYLAAGRLHAHP